MVETEGGGVEKVGVSDTTYKDVASLELEGLQLSALCAEPSACWVLSSKVLVPLLEPSWLEMVETEIVAVRRGEVMRRTRMSPVLSSKGSDSAPSALSYRRAGFRVPKHWCHCSSQAPRNG